MMGGIDLISHLFQCKNDISSRIFSQINRGSIQITGLFMSQRGWHSIVIGMKQEEFALRIDLQCVPFFLCLFYYSF